MGIKKIENKLHCMIHLKMYFIYKNIIWNIELYFPISFKVEINPFLITRIDTLVDVLERIGHIVELLVTRFGVFYKLRNCKLEDG